MNLSYETAKRLKDAGLVFEYPQTRENTYSYLNSDGNPCGALGKDAVYVPTLPELIKACVRQGRYLRLNQNDYQGWAACLHDAKLIIHQIGEGPTPEESVAELWLALHAD